jgi:ubiquinol-cytochrome c reductase cytochrome b subunit
MNQLGLAGAPVPGSMLRPDPPEETRALEQARRDAAAHDEDTSSEAEARRLAGRPQQPTD